jgi:hypothetical protein
VHLKRQWTFRNLALDIGQLVKFRFDIPGYGFVSIYQPEDLHIHEDSILFAFLPFHNSIFSKEILNIIATKDFAILEKCCPLTTPKSSART